MVTAPLIVGTLGEKVGWHYGFAAAGVGMLIGLVIYLAGQKYLPVSEERAGGPVAKVGFAPGESAGFVALLLLIR